MRIPAVWVLLKTLVGGSSFSCPKNVPTTAAAAVVTPARQRSHRLERPPTAVVLLMYLISVGQVQSTETYGLVGQQSTRCLTARARLIQCAITSPELLRSSEYYGETSSHPASTAFW